MLPLSLVHRVGLFGESIEHTGQTFAESLHERILFASRRTFGRNFDSFIHFDDHFERAMNAGSVGEVLLQSFYGFENAGVGRWRVKIFWGGRTLSASCLDRGRYRNLESNIAYQPRHPHSGFSQVR